MRLAPVTDLIYLYIKQLGFESKRMSGYKRSGFLWGKIVELAFVLVVLYVLGYFLKTVYDQHGSEKFIYSLVLVSSLVIGVAYILLFISRKLLEKDNSTIGKRKKRKLEKIRNGINYITPFVLVAMAYHFWQEGWVLAIIIVVILLLDRLNELLRMNK